MRTPAGRSSAAAAPSRRPSACATSAARASPRSSRCRSATPGPRPPWARRSRSVSTTFRAAEQARECDDQRKKSQFAKALDATRKALAIEPNLPAAHICIATVYEAQHMPLDSLLAAYQRAAKGDSLNATAWENIAHVYQQKGDTLKAIDALTHELAGEPHNI